MFLLSKADLQSDELINSRLIAMNTFINDDEKGKEEKRYIYNELPKLSFKNDSFDLKNKKSQYLEPILDILQSKGFETKIITTNYEFQKGANKLLSIK